jgi:prepilin-type N-terminal cleavage/methylation domain-containing protein
MSRSDEQQVPQHVTRRRRTSPVAGVRGYRSARERNDDGFTVIELSFSMIIFSIISALTLMLVTTMLNNSTAVNDTLLGISQASVANRSFTQYLRSVSVVNVVNTNGNTLEFTATVGTGSHTTACPGQSAPAAGVEVICNEDVTATLATTHSPLVDELEVIFGPFGVASSDRVVASFDIVPPGTSRAPAAQIFQYYTLGGANGTTLVNDGATWANANPTLIQGIGLDAAFLPPPGPGKEGFAAELATVVHTIAFLRNPGV